MADVNVVSSRPSREHVRARILDAAMSTFARYGFAGTTTDAVANAAGFTKGAVYSNFASKDDLFFALMDQQIEIRARLAADVVRDLPPHAAAALAVIGERLTNAMTENRDWQVLFLDYWARAVRDPVIGARFAEHRRAARQVITEAIVELAQSLNVTMPLPPDLVTLVILGLSNGLAVEELADPGTVPSSLIGTVLNRLAAPSS